MSFKLVFLFDTANEVRINGVRYKSTAIVRVKMPHQEDPFIVASKIYVYKDNKFLIFVLVQLHIDNKHMFLTRLHASLIEDISIKFCGSMNLHCSICSSNLSAHILERGKDYYNSKKKKYIYIYIYIYTYFTIL